MPLSVPLLYGSMRDGRKSEAVAKYIHAELLKRGVESAYVSVGEYRGMMSLERRHPDPWKTIMEKADALVVVSPEYNHGYPGPLKETLDSLYEEYHQKPIGIVGAAGVLGGGRMVEQLRQVAIELHMVPIREALYFPFVWTLLDEQGNLKPDPAYGPRVEAFFTELFWYAEVLQEARKTRPLSK